MHENHSDPSDSSAYANEAVGAIAQLAKDYDLSNKSTGIWKSGDRDEYGLTFMFGVVLDYFRCSSNATKALHDAGDLEGVEYVVAPWEVDELIRRGFTLIHDENWVYLYKAPPVAQ